MQNNTEVFFYGYKVKVRLSGDVEMLMVVVVEMAVVVDFGFFYVCKVKVRLSGDVVMLMVVVVEMVVVADMVFMVAR